MKRFAPSLTVLTLWILVLLVLCPGVVLCRELGYRQYLAGFSQAPRPELELTLLASDFSNAHHASKLADGNVLIAEEGYIQWMIDVPEAGLYNISLVYLAAPGRGASMEQELLINGERPFAEARYLIFHRTFGDGGPTLKDSLGNEIRPVPVEYPRGRTQPLVDSRGYTQEPFLFYLPQGPSAIRLMAHQEPIVIERLLIGQVNQPSLYQEVKESWPSQETRGFLLKIQGEDALYRSHSTLFAISDTGDPTIEPYHPAQIRLNSIGGWRFNQPGQWITWEFTVPKSGLYTIAFKAKQNIRRGISSNRRVLMDGEVPFAELCAVEFPYSTHYHMQVLGHQNEPYLIYLTEGRHELTLEVVLGDQAALVQAVETSLYELNSIYRRIIMVISPDPDPLRDYQLAERIPEVLVHMAEQAALLHDLADHMEESTQQRGGHMLTVRNLALQLESMAATPESIQVRLEEYRDNLSALGTWILQTMEQPLQIDYLLVASPDVELPEASPTLWQTVRHECSKLASSFTHDYSALGDRNPGTSGERTIKVWIGTGRDQAQALKTIIEDSFTPQTGIRVDLELVNMNILLQATLAGRGPDVALGVDPSQPMNFGLREAVVDLTEFSDFPQVAAGFYPAALEPFTFRDWVFALPEQLPFFMLFYRQDILNELGLEVPQSWDEVLYIIPELQKDNMNFGLPYTVINRSVGGNIGEAPAGGGSLSASQGVLTFLMFLNQQGVDLFQEDAEETNLYTQTAFEAFQFWTDLYELYNLPVEYSAENRFRLGEMPLVIAPYTLYNTLTVFAPELRGEWGFAPVPGVVRDDGIIDRTVPASGTASVILSSASDPEASWEFLKWWSEAETQTRYALDLEALMGEAARYPTANPTTLRNLPWPLEDYRKLEEQLSWVQGVPEVPGGYMVGRHLDNAFRRIVEKQAPIRETLLDYNRVMNEEIRSKRAELGLDEEGGSRP
ncbi:MAG: extracellular solute-binding protein [Limnochordia bacterium]|nr:extracellular solute-binding protein [Limnochordia bacterium]NLL49280.1 extracellular solute-binding protein [Bacillota bacterium]